MHRYSGIPNKVGSKSGASVNSSLILSANQLAVSCEIKQGAADTKWDCQIWPSCF